MKALITAKTDNSLTLQLSDNAFLVGQKVTIEDARHGTGEQNRLFHALIHEWVASGCCSYSGGFEAVKASVKRDLGASFEFFLYADDDAKIVKAKTLLEIPKRIRADIDRVYGKLKSWADYTKKERMTTLDNLIADMIESGVNSKKFNEIMEELNDR